MAANRICVHPLVRQALAEASHGSPHRAFKMLLHGGAWETGAVGPLHALPPRPPLRATAFICVPPEVKAVWYARWGRTAHLTLTRLALKRLHDQHPALVARVYTDADQSIPFNADRLVRFLKWQQQRSAQ